jgi:hypothetical protein
MLISSLVPASIRIIFAAAAVDCVVFVFGEIVSSCKDFASCDLLLKNKCL